MLNFTFLISHLSLFTFACVQIRHTPLSGGYCGGVPPLPIPNREVKPTCADGTAMQCGRVGRRLLSMKSLRFRKISEAFSFFFQRIFSSPLDFSSRWILFCHADFSNSLFFLVGNHWILHIINPTFSRYLKFYRFRFIPLLFYHFPHVSIR